jgi:hypothetical protein
LVSISLGLLLALPSASAQTSSGHKVRKSPQQQAVLPPAPEGPLPQVPLDQLPAAPPQVDYQDGRLTIVAENSTLGDILREVRKQTGASIDVPSNATERVVARLGPAPAREVLAALLNGSSFNYVLVGSVTDPAALSSVMLSSRPGTGDAKMVAEVYQPSPVNAPPDQLGASMAKAAGLFPAAQQVPPRPGNPPAVTPQAADDDDSADDSDQDDAENQDQNQNQNPSPQPANPGLGLEHGLDAMQQNFDRIQQQRQQQGQPPQSAPPH